MSVATSFASVVPPAVRPSPGRRTAARSVTGSVAARAAVTSADRSAGRRRSRPAGATPLRQRVTRSTSVVRSARCVGAPVAATPSAVRLTGRGWVLVLATGATVAGILIAVAWWSHPATAAAPAPAPAGTTVTVRPGDSLWSIAGRLVPGRDPRPVVDALRRTNHLASVEIQPGQQLVLG